MMIPTPNLPFTIGNDICRIARVRQILAGGFGRRFVRRILRNDELRPSTTANILQCVLEPTTAPHESRDAPGLARAAEFMAGRFAAKEAVIKAHPHRHLSFSSIAIVRTTRPASSAPANSSTNTLEEVGEHHRQTTQDQDGAAGEPTKSGPLVAVIRASGDVRRDTYASVSISHDTEYATAVCLAVNPAAMPVA
ncbi:hypothetical protein F5Y14DRAFT_424177, partial [Nemania sp. NC0429]